MRERALMLGLTLPLPEVPRTLVQDRLGSGASRPPSRKVPPVRSKLSRVCWALWQRLCLYFFWVCFTMRPIQFWLKLRVPSTAWHHRRHRVTVTRAWVSALARWRDPFWLKQGVILDTAHRRKVVMTDASNKGWGALCEGKPTFSLRSEEESGLHINCIEMLAVCQACQFFLPDIRGHHVLVRSDSRSVVSYINRSDSARWRTTFFCELRTTCAHVRRMCRAKWTKEQTCCRGTMSLQRNERSTSSWFREIGKSLAEHE